MLAAARSSGWGAVGAGRVAPPPASQVKRQQKPLSASHPPRKQCSTWVDSGHLGSPALPSAVEAPARHTGPAGAADRDLAGGDGGPAAQAHEHLLAVVQQAAIAELLERARRLSQHAHALPRRRQEAGRQVAGGQQQGLGVLPPRGPRFQLRRRACAHHTGVRGGAASAPGRSSGPGHAPCGPAHLRRTSGASDPSPWSVPYKELEHSRLSRR